MNILFYLLAFISGAGVTLQAGVNGRLRQSLGSSILAPLISFFVGTLVLVVAYIITVAVKAQSIPAIDNVRQTSWWMWVGGLLGAFYMFVAVIAMPRIGVGNTMILIIAGQLVLAVILDHFGVFGPVDPITPTRIVGIVLMCIGVYIIKKF